MTRGNQRDLARAKAQKKQQEEAKKKGTADKSGLTLEQRRERDAQILRDKQAAKASAGEAGSANK